MLQTLTKFIYLSRVKTIYVTSHCFTFMCMTWEILLTHWFENVPNVYAPYSDKKGDISHHVKPVVREFNEIPPNFRYVSISHSRAFCASPIFFENGKNQMDVSRICRQDAILDYLIVQHLVNVKLNIFY